jgi:dTDP-4-amino-4,6-dideoxygalactose transaminase
VKKGIGTAIHYPIPIHLQPASKYLGYKKGHFLKLQKTSKNILTIPIHQYLKKTELNKIVYYLNKFAKELFINKKNIR